MAAASYVADPKDFLEKAKKFDQRIEVVDYEITGVMFGANGFEAIVGVKRIYTISPSVTAHTQNLDQKWIFDRKKKDWFLVSPY